MTRKDSQLLLIRLRRSRTIILLSLAAAFSAFVSLILSNFSPLLKLIAAILVCGLWIDELSKYLKQPRIIRYRPVRSSGLNSGWALMIEAGEIDVDLQKGWQITPWFSFLRFRDQVSGKIYVIAIVPDSCSQEEQRRIRFVVKNCERERVAQID